MEDRDAPLIFEPAYYDRLGEIEERHWWALGMQAAMDALLAAEPLPATARILDAGCGTGHLLSRFGARLPGARLHGIDLSVDALRHARGRAGIHVAAGDATRLPFQDSSFDLAVCIDTLQHVPSAGRGEELVAELHRVLVPGGLLYLRANSAAGRRRIEADERSYRRYTTPEVAAMLDGAGFEVRRATYVNMLPGAWGALREALRGGGHHHGHHAADGTPALTIRMPRLAAVNAVLRSVLSGEAAWLRRGGTLPFGHSTAFVARRKKEPR